MLRVLMVLVVLGARSARRVRRRWLGRRDRGAGRRRGHRQAAQRRGCVDQRASIPARRTSTINAPAGWVHGDLQRPADPHLGGRPVSLSRSAAGQLHRYGDQGDTPTARRAESGSADRRSRSCSPPTTKHPTSWCVSGRTARSPGPSPTKRASRSSACRCACSRAPRRRRGSTTRRFVRVGSRPFATTVSPALTDDRGVYRFGNLTPGEYFVVAVPPSSRQPAHFQRHPSGAGSRDMVALMRHGDGRNVGSSGRCAGRSAVAPRCRRRPQAGGCRSTHHLLSAGRSPAQATTISWVRAKSARRSTSNWRPCATARVSGTLMRRGTARDGDPAAGAGRRRRDAAGIVAPASVSNGTGDFIFAAVVPGRYALHASTSGGAPGCRARSAGHDRRRQHRRAGGRDEPGAADHRPPPVRRHDAAAASATPGRPVVQVRSSSILPTARA